MSWTTNYGHTGHKIITFTFQLDKDPEGIYYSTTTGLPHHFGFGGYTTVFHGICGFHQALIWKKNFDIKSKQATKIAEWWRRTQERNNTASCAFDNNYFQYFGAEVYPSYNDGTLPPSNYNNNEDTNDLTDDWYIVPGFEYGVDFEDDDNNDISDLPIPKLVRQTADST